MVIEKMFSDEIYFGVKILEKSEVKWKHLNLPGSKIYSFSLYICLSHRTVYVIIVSLA